MASIKLRYIPLLYCLLHPGPSAADHPSIGMGLDIGGPIITNAATVPPRHQVSLALRMEYISLDNYSDSRLEQFAAQGKGEVESTNFLFTPSLSAGYGVTDNLMVALRLPYIRRENTKGGELDNGVADVDIHGDTEGIGDLSILGQYRFFQSGDRTLLSSVIVGLELPTGETDVEDNHGDRHEIEHQPGSGSWDPSIGIALTRLFDPLVLDANITYTLATEGARRTTLNDQLNFNAALSYRVEMEKQHDHSHDEAHSHYKWDFIIELNGEWHSKIDVDGDKDPHSGGTLVYLSPGLRMTPVGDWSFSLSVGRPVVQDLNGKQHETDWRIIAGTSLRL